MHFCRLYEYSGRDAFGRWTGETDRNSSEKEKAAGDQIGFGRGVGDGPCAGDGQPSPPADYHDCLLSGETLGDPLDQQCGHRGDL